MCARTNLLLRKPKLEFENAITHRDIVQRLRRANLRSGAFVLSQSAELKIVIAVGCRTAIGQLSLVSEAGGLRTADLDAGFTTLIGFRGGSKQ